MRKGFLKKNFFFFFLVRGCTSAKHWVSFALHQATTLGATCPSRAEWGRRVGPRPGSPTPTAKGSENDRPQTLSPASPSTHYTPKFEWQPSLGDLLTSRAEIAAERKRRIAAAEAPPFAGAARDYLAAQRVQHAKPRAPLRRLRPSPLRRPARDAGRTAHSFHLLPAIPPAPAEPGAPARPSRPSTRRALLTQLAQAALR